MSAMSGGGRLPSVADAALARYRRSMDSLAIHEGVAAAFELIDAANGFIAETAPWALAKDSANAERLGGVLFDVAEAIRVAAVLLLPVMPESCAEILRRIGERTAAGELRLDRDAQWRAAGERSIIKGPALWPRADDKASVPKEIRVEEKPTQMADAGAPVAAAPATAPPAVDDNRISIDEFMKVELRAARVLDAEAVPKSKKLIKLSVDLGAERRTILAGIAEAYRPEELLNRMVVVVANLKPAKLMGIESNGMLLAASAEGGKPTLVSVPDGVEPGWRVR